MLPTLVLTSARVKPPTTKPPSGLRRAATRIGLGSKFVPTPVVLELDGKVYYELENEILVRMVTELLPRSDLPETPDVFLYMTKQPGPTRGALVAVADAGMRPATLFALFEATFDAEYQEFESVMRVGSVAQREAIDEERDEMANRMEALSVELREVREEAQRLRSPSFVLLARDSAPKTPSKAPIRKRGPMRVGPVGPQSVEELSDGE